MLGDLPGNNSQLDLRPFGAGFLTMGSKGSALIALVHKGKYGNFVGSKCVTLLGVK